MEYISRTFRYTEKCLGEEIRFERLSYSVGILIDYLFCLKEYTRIKYIPNIGVFCKYFIYFASRAASAINAPYVTHLENNCKTETCFDGMYAVFWKTLSKQMNFTYTIQRETVWGVLVNGSWQGIIGEKQ